MADEYDADRLTSRLRSAFAVEIHEGDLSREDVEDAASTGCLAAFVQGAKSPEAYAYVVARNHCMKAIERNLRRKLGTSMLITEFTTSLSSSGLEEDIVAVMNLVNAIDKLKSIDQAIIFSLVDGDADKTSDAMRQRIHRARERLAEEL